MKHTVTDGEHGHGGGMLLEPVEQELDRDPVPGRLFVSAVDLDDRPPAGVLGTEARVGIEPVQPAADRPRQRLAGADGEQGELDRRGVGM